MRQAMMFTLAVLVSGCASMGKNEGWQGVDAQPFDTAKALCEAEAVARADPADVRTAAFEACMASQGWHRPARTP
jgi:hypothetical protein